MTETATPKKKHRVLKWVTVVAGIIILLLAAAAWYVNKKWKPLLTDAIQNALIDASDSLYTVKFSDIQVNILSGNATVDSIQLIPNLNVYEKMKASGDAPENIFSLKIFKLSLKNVKPIKVYQQKKLDIKNITIQNPELDVFYTKIANKKSKPKDNRSPYERIKKSLKELKINSLFLTDVKFRYIDQSYKEPKITEFDQMNIRVNDILVDSLSHTDTTRIFNAKDIIAEINNYSYPTADSLYFIKIKHAFVSSKKKQLAIAGMELAPRLGEMAFAAQFKRQQERYKLYFDSVLVNQLNFNELVDNRRIKTKNVVLQNGNLDVFMSRAKPPKLIDKGVNYPHLALRRLKWDVIADTVTIKNTQVAYAEYNPKTDAKGTVYFKQLQGRIFHVTNDSLYLKKDVTADAFLQARVMGEGRLDIHIAFNLIDPKGAFSYKGTLGAMSFNTLNPLTKPLGMLATKSGELQSLDFDIKGNVNGASGTLVMKYKDLKIAVMKKDDEDHLKKSGIISFLANALLVKNANPDGDEPLRVAHPSYQRPHDASFFNLMWKTVFEGLKTSVGITKDKEDNLKKRADKYKQSKLEREKRREERVKRRKERKEK